MTVLDVFKLQNPWRESMEVKIPQYVERELFSDIVSWLFEKDLLIILGPRQSGKTTLLKKLIEYLLEKNTSPDQIFYFNLDSEELIELFQNPHDFVKFVKAYQPKSSFVLIDEVQRVENAGLFLKNIYDLDTDIKLIVSGSSSLELKAKIKEYLTGRKKEFLLYPFSFKEFLKAKKLNPPPLKLSGWSDLEEMNRIFGNDLLKEFMEYAVWGGYPKVVLRQTKGKKLSELEEIYKSYVKKDIKDFLGIEDIMAFNKLVSLTAYQIGNLINKHELSTSVGSSWRTIEKYLTILEKTFILKQITPYSSNRRKEITRMPKGFYFDLGLRNFIVKNFGNLEERGDKGSLAENFALKELIKPLRSPGEICFWRTQAKAEVDFVIVSAGRVTPIEVKFSKFKKASIPRSYKSFMENYQPKQGLILTQDFLYKTKIEKMEIIYLPVYLLPFWIEKIKGSV